MRDNIFAKTKIICTLGPSTDTAPMIASMIRAGMDVVRLNFSHGTLRKHIATMHAIKKAEDAVGRPLTIIQDLQGPKIRLGDISVPFIELKQNQLIDITTKDVLGTNKRLSTTYKLFAKDLKIGNRVLFDDGKIDSKVVGLHKDTIRLKIITGGKLTAHKGINLPDTNISATCLTEKDKEDLQFAFKYDVDYVSLSFVRSPLDIKLLRDYIRKHSPKKKSIQIIAKIEKPEAIKNIEEILREADAVMVARGDLGVEMPAEEVPILQKKIVRRCNELGKPVIIATQMLESMISNPRPTRAETSDVANAVFDGTDAVMLSGETAVGRYPVRAVKVMDKVIRNAERHILRYRDYHPELFPSTHAYDFLCHSACRLADELRASAIVTVTNTGTTAIRLAKYRPSVKIIAITDSEFVLHRLNLVWGIRSMVLDRMRVGTDESLKEIENLLVKWGYVKKGDKIVLLAGIPLFRRHSTNMIKVETV
jgi:pyruvate kinase